MKINQPLWSADATGTLSAEIADYRVTVMRLAPAAEARFVVWTVSKPPVPVRSGIRRSTEAAMLAAELCALKMMPEAEIREAAN